MERGFPSRLGRYHSIVRSRIIKLSAIQRLEKPRSKSLRFLHDLFPEKRQELAFDVGMCGGEPLCTVDFPDLRLHACGVSEGAQEFVRGQVGKPDAIHAAAFAEDIFTGVERKHCIADPCGFPFDFQQFVACHMCSVIPLNLPG